MQVFSVEFSEKKCRSAPIMATKPLGKGTSNLSVNLPHQALRDELESLAAKSGMKLGPYIRIVLANAAQKGARVAQKFGQLIPGRR